MTADNMEPVGEEHAESDLPTEPRIEDALPTELERRLRRDLARSREQVRAAQAERDAAISDVTARSEARLVQAELRFHAMRSGIVDLDVLRLIDPTDIKLGEDGSVQGADTAIDALKTSKPYLFKSGHATPPLGVALGQVRRPPSPAAPETVDARTLSREQWQAERSRLLGRTR